MSEAMALDHSKRQLIPISLLIGFLGSGKNHITQPLGAATGLKRYVGYY
jgi:hypothetical protein